MPVLYNQCVPYVPFILVGEVLECCKLPSLCGDQQVDVAAMTQNSKLNQTFRKELPQNCFKYFKKELPQIASNISEKNFFKIASNRKRTSSKLQIGKELPQNQTF